MANPTCCALCQRVVPLTEHHLIPRKLHKRSAFTRRFDKKALMQTVLICRLCHNGIHQIYDESHLGTHLNTLDALRTDPALAKHVAWVSKQKILR